MAQGNNGNFAWSKAARAGHQDVASIIDEAINAQKERIAEELRQMEEKGRKMEREQEQREQEQREQEQQQDGSAGRPQDVLPTGAAGLGAGAGAQQAPSTQPVPRSRYAGVEWDPVEGAWNAQVTFWDGHTRSLGYYRDEAQAAQARGLAVAEYDKKGTVHGPFPGRLATRISGGR